MVLSVFKGCFNKCFVVKRGGRDFNDIRFVKVMNLSEGNFLRGVLWSKSVVDVIRKKIIIVFNFVVCNEIKGDGIFFEGVF